MPMIDVYTPDGVDREIAESLGRPASRRRSTRQLRSVPIVFTDRWVER